MEKKYVLRLEGPVGQKIWVAVKFVGVRSDGTTDWTLLGPRTADWLQRELEVEASHHG